MLPDADDSAGNSLLAVLDLGIICGEILLDGSGGPEVVGVVVGGVEGLLPVVVVVGRIHYL